MTKSLDASPYFIYLHHILRAIWNYYREKLPLKSELTLQALTLHNLQTIVFYSYKYSLVSSSLLKVKP